MQGEFIFPSNWGKNGQAIGYGESLTGDEPFFYPIFKREIDCTYFIDSIECLQNKAKYISFMDLWYNFAQAHVKTGKLYMPTDNFEAYARDYGWPLKEDGVFDGYFTCDEPDYKLSYPLFKKPIYLPLIYKKGEIL